MSRAVFFSFLVHHILEDASVKRTKIPTFEDVSNWVCRLFGLRDLESSRSSAADVGEGQLRNARTAMPPHDTEAQPITERAGSDAHCHDSDKRTCRFIGACKNTDVWESLGRVDRDRAAVIRAVLKISKSGEPLDPWLPFPQNSCGFTFGKEDRPLPVGALLYLWKEWHALTGRCPECNGRVFGYGFVGLMSSGALTGCCIECATTACRRVVLGIFRGELTPILKSTPFNLKTYRFGGTFEGSRAPLVEALRKFGVTDLPDKDWIRGGDASAFEVRITSRQEPSIV